MQWRTICVCAVSLVAMTGCPEEFGKKGRVNKAIHKDLMERLQKKCTPAQLDEFCTDEEQLEECLKWCG